jgi:hypothetical protein
MQQLLCSQTGCILSRLLVPQSLGFDKMGLKEREDESLRERERERERNDESARESESLSQCGCEDVIPFPMRFVHLFLQI